MKNLTQERKYIDVTNDYSRFFNDSDFSMFLYQKLKRNLDPDQQRADRISNVFHGYSKQLIIEFKIGNITIDGKIVSYHKFKIDDNGNMFKSEEKFKMKIGKFLKNILKIEFSQKEIDDIVGTLTEDVSFEIVYGESIRHYYKEDNYDEYSGTLNSSCMRYDSCQSYFNVYTNSPSCQMLIVKRQGKDKIVGRALLWDGYYADGEQVKFIDRIYSPSILANKISEYAKSLSYTSVYDLPKGVVIDISTDEDDSYPYLDNMCYFFRHEGTGKTSLSNEYDIASSLAKRYSDIERLQNTHGGFHFANCGECQDSIRDEDDAYWIERSEMYVCQHCLDNYYVYVQSVDEYVNNDDAEYCECCKEYSLCDDMVTIGINCDTRVCEHCTDDHDNMRNFGFIYVEDECGYIEEDLVVFCRCCSDPFLKSKSLKISDRVYVCEDCFNDEDKMKGIGYAFNEVNERYNIIEGNNIIDCDSLNYVIQYEIKTEEICQ